MRIRVFVRRAVECAVMLAFFATLFGCTQVVRIWLEDCPRCEVRP